VRVIAAKIAAAVAAATRGVTWDGSFVLPGEDGIPEFRIGAAVIATAILAAIVFRRKKEAE
jgi:hypothetical protein